MYCHCGGLFPKSTSITCEQVHSKLQYNHTIFLLNLSDFSTFKFVLVPGSSQPSGVVSDYVRYLRLRSAFMRYYCSKLDSYNGDQNLGNRFNQRTWFTVSANRHGPAEPDFDCLGGR
jgi:hypothetical protein